MADLTREYLAEKRKNLTEQIVLIRGALEMLDLIEGELFPKDALTMDDLKNLTGAQSVDILPVEGSN